MGCRTKAPKLSQAGAMMQELTELQWQRLAYGAAHEILRQAVDNGELPNVEYEEFLPSSWEGFETPEDEIEFNTKYQQAVESVMSNLWEEQAKRD